MSVPPFDVRVKRKLASFVHVRWLVDSQVQSVAGGL